MAKPALTFWYDFASPYSWLAAERIADLAAQADIEIIWKPFLLGPIFATQGWTTSPFNIYEVKGRNMWRDLDRLAADMGLPPLTRPEPFPQHSLLAARVATALPADFRPVFSRAVFRAEFTEAQSIAERRVLFDLLRDITGDPEATLAAADHPNNKAALRAAIEQARALGIYGAPSFTTASGELFWGNDRLEQALVWARRT